MDQRGEEQLQVKVEVREGDLTFSHSNYAIPGARLTPEGYRPSKLNDRVWVDRNISGNLTAVECDGAGKTRGWFMAEHVGHALFQARGATTKALETAIGQGWAAAVEGARGEELGTTVTAIVIDGREVSWVHVGDSRFYVFRGGKLYQITDDHDQFHQRARQLERAGFSAAEALQQAKREGCKENVLTRCLSTDSMEPDPIDSGVVQLYPGDGLLLCSDGVTKYLSNEDVALLIPRATETPNPAQYIAQVARNRAEADRKQRIDDISAAFITVEETGKQASRRFRFPFSR